MALHTGLRYPKALAGIMALSMPIPLPDRIASELNSANAHVPVFLAHGTQDQVVPYAMGDYGYRLLVQLGLSVEWHRYQMGHTVTQEELSDIRTWLGHVLIP
jgi:phospholipase/carboxylesterase